MKIKYKGQIYYIEFYNFNNSIRSMLIIMKGLKIVAISSKLNSKEKSKELHMIIKSKLRVIKWGNR